MIDLFVYVGFNSIYIHMCIYIYMHLITSYDSI